MTLISMLLALIIERLAVRSNAWQARPYCQAYLQLTTRSRLSQLAEHPLGRYLWVLLPGIAVALLLHLMDNRLLTLVINTLVLLVGIGCWHYRQHYKQYLNAKARSDEEGAFLAIEQMRLESGSQLTQHSTFLVWLNFRYYAAVVFWFLLLGAFGVITYVLLRHLHEQSQTDTTAQQDSAAEFAQSTTDAETSEYASEVADEATVTENAERLSEADSIDATTANEMPFATLLHWADWFPTRLFGLGFALVGHFSKATHALLGYFLDFTASNEQVIAEVARAAEPVAADQQDSLDDTSSLVQLAKRNMLFFLAFTAVLTLTGWLS